MPLRLVLRSLKRERSDRHDSPVQAAVQLGSDWALQLPKLVQHPMQTTPGFQLQPSPGWRMSRQFAKTGGGVSGEGAGGGDGDDGADGDDGDGGMLSAGAPAGGDGGVGHESDMVETSHWRQRSSHAIHGDDVRRRPDTASPRG